ncbi:hypothetical conserved protein [Candidatus Nitrosoglobus terrae]|uniref:Hypothetical conserved protein n=1 Tax=Candidatus Nitrosoglobus terrae TaxID=1630141 RepID=A0A1Q2SLI2_9GAMM|nr:hypothetical protein [Candidatus Nitrosoglobus terrae]BAW79957.1 hypothetical conserved protein [Candidatus Nitrosoglobus terrae]
MNKIKKYALLFFPLILVGLFAVKTYWLDAGGIVLPTGKKVTAEELHTQAVLAIIADQINKNLPRMVDHETKLSKVEALEGELKYNYDKINRVASSFNSREFVNKMKPRAVDLACNSPDMALYFENGINAHYVFYGSDHQLIGEFLITPVQCSY